MEIGIGLPATIPGIDGPALLAWARRAEARGFSTLGVIDRLVYANYDPLIALAAAASVTDRIRLTTSILLAPLHANSALLAKQAATIDNLSGGRLVLGLAVGGRDDDYEASGLDVGRRGKLMDALLDDITGIWASAAKGDADGIGPPPARPGGPELLLGGGSPATFDRLVRYGQGWVSGGGGAKPFRAGAQRALEAWEDAGRAGRPRLVALAYFGLGPGGAAHATDYLTHYYRFTGPMAERIAASAVTDADGVGAAVEGFAAAGCDELIFFPSSTDTDQVDLLADAAGLP